MNDEQPQPHPLLNVERDTLLPTPMTQAQAASAAMPTSSQRCPNPDMSASFKIESNESDAGSKNIICKEATAVTRQPSCQTRRLSSKKEDGADNPDDSLEAPPGKSAKRRWKKKPKKARTKSATDDDVHLGSEVVDDPDGDGDCMSHYKIQNVGEEENVATGVDSGDHEGPTFDDATASARLSSVDGRGATESTESSQSKRAKAKKNKARKEKKKRKLETKDKTKEDHKKPFSGQKVPSNKKRRKRKSGSSKKEEPKEPKHAPDQESKLVDDPDGGENVVSQSETNNTSNVASVSASNAPKPAQKVSSAEKKSSSQQPKPPKIDASPSSATAITTHTAVSKALESSSEKKLTCTKTPSPQKASTVSPPTMNIPRKSSAGADVVSNAAKQSSEKTLSMKTINPDDDFNDDFNLLTQSNGSFNMDVDGGLSSDESGDGSKESGGSSSEDDDSDSDSSLEDTNDMTPLQERNRRNILRNKAFARNLGFDVMMNGDDSGQLRKGHEGVDTKSKGNDMAREDGSGNTSAKCAGDKQEEALKVKKRGMVFSTARMPHKTSSNVSGSTGDADMSVGPHLCTKSLEDDLTPNHPHRSKQIHHLCSQLANTVHKTKFAWQMSGNVCSSFQYSEASNQGDIKLATPSPIMITGAAGNGKTRIVCAAVNALRRRTNVAGTQPNVADAYIDCASYESGSMAEVMNNAHRQIYECYDPCSASDQHYHRLKDGMEQSAVEGDVSVAGFESDAGDDESLEEDFLECHKQRNYRKSEKSKPQKTNKVKSRGDKKNIRQTRLRTSLVTKAKKEPALQSPGLKGLLYNAANKNSQSRGTVALFGRSTSALIQGNTTNKQTAENWRCAFLVLDNADRILSWQKHGPTPPLTQLFLLPSLMGINLTLIFISRSTIFQYSPAVYNAPGKLLDAVHPVTIHFDSYSSVEVIKSILHVPHVQQSITGSSFPMSHMLRCNHAHKLMSKFNNLLYSSMMNSLIPTVKSSTHDLTEIMRLARLLWPEYVAALTSIDDSSIESFVWQALCCIGRDTDSWDEQCQDSNCSFCRWLSFRSEGDGAAMNMNVLKQTLSERLDKNIRERMRSLLSTTALMPGRVLSKQTNIQHAARLPYTTKFLLLAAFLCQNKHPEQDVNLFTTTNTGKSKRSRTGHTDEGSAYASSAKDLTKRQPSFPLERMLSAFSSIIGQYGQQHRMTYKEKGASTVFQLGTDSLFQNISQLIVTGLLCPIRSSKMNDKIDHCLMEMTSTKFSCTMNRDDARVIAHDVGFPLETYCP